MLRRPGVGARTIIRTDFLRCWQGRPILRAHSYIRKRYSPMPVQPCPVCRRTTPRWLEASSKEAPVNYYRCEGCGHVWVVPKTNPAAPPTVITTIADGP